MCFLSSLPSMHPMLADDSIWVRDMPSQLTPLLRSWTCSNNCNWLCCWSAILVAHISFTAIRIVMHLIIYMKTFCDSLVESSAVQCNARTKSVSPVQITRHRKSGLWLAERQWTFLTQWYHAKWGWKFCAETLKNVFSRGRKILPHANFFMFILLISK